MRAGPRQRRSGRGGNRRDSASVGATSENSTRNTPAATSATPCGDGVVVYQRSNHAMRRPAIRAALQPFAEMRRQRAGHEAEGDAPGRLDPLLVERVLQEERDAELEREGAHAIAPGAAEPLLEVAPLCWGARTAP